MSKQVDTRSDVETEAREVSKLRLSVVLDRLTHHFGARCVFRDLSCSVQSGQILLITGANGSGKSTLLRIIAGLLAPSSGSTEVRVEGEPRDTSSRRRFMGYVSPDLVLYRELTGAENLQFFAELHGIGIDRGALIDLLSRVGLRGRGRDLVAGYSSGMRQRLKYAFALLHNPPILLLDEPTANLDVEGAAIVERIVKGQRERPGGGLAIVATNEVRELSWSPLRIDIDGGA